MPKKNTPEEELQLAQQRKNRAIAAEKRAREKIRKADQRVKCELGGLATKAGLKETDRKTVFGILCFGSDLVRTGQTPEQFADFFQRVGAAAWERFAIEKDRKLFKDLTEEETRRLLSDVAAVARSLPFPSFGSNAPVTKNQTPSAQPTKKRQLVQSSGLAGFEEEV